MTGGGSGGHITPLLSLARELKNIDPNCHLSYIGYRGDSFDSLRQRYHGFNEMAFITAGKYRRYHGETFWRRIADINTLFLNIRDFFRTLKGIREAYKALKQIEPDLVFSKGSFVAVPVGIAARLQKVPIITHDSDTLSGLANKIIGRWAALNAVGSKFGDYPYPKSKQVYTGIPIDQNIKPVNAALMKDYRTQLNLPQDAEILLVGGAGLGSKDINDKFAEISPELLKKNPKLLVIHITGDQHSNDVTNRYNSIMEPDQTKRIKVIGFANEFYKYSGSSDLIVTRGGATVLAELAAQHKAAIVIPAPFLAGGHQLKNAERLRRIGAIEYLSNDASTQNLLDLINQLLQNKQGRLRLGEKFGSTAEPQAAQKLAGIILGIANGATSEAPR